MTTRVPALLRVAALGAVLALAACGGPSPDEAELANLDNEIAAEGDLLHAPAPTPAAADDPLATLRQDSAARRGTACGGALAYDLAWAKRLPVVFDVYPDARVTRAAGSEKGDCRMRLVAFTSEADVGRILDWYHTIAIRAGYSSEHQTRGAEHILGGANERDGGAFYLVAAPLEGGGSDVALIANNGR